MKLKPFALALLVAALPLAFVPARGDDAGKGLTAAVQPFVENHSLAGAVMLVADKNKILKLETAGYADIAAKSLMGPKAVFWIASQSKPITAAAS